MAIYGARVFENELLVSGAATAFCSFSAIQTETSHCLLVKALFVVLWKFFGSFVTSLMSCYCNLRDILAGWPLLGRFTTVPSVLHLEIMALTVVWRSPRALEMALEWFKERQVFT